MTTLVLPNLHVPFCAYAVVGCKKVNQVFIVQLQERPFDRVRPRAGALVAYLTCALENCRYRARYNAHAIVWVRGVRIKVYARHSKRLARAGLAIREHSAIKAVEEATEERLRRRREHVVLRRFRREDVVEREGLLFHGCGRSGGRSGRPTRGADGGGYEVYGDRIRRGGVDDGALEAVGDGVCVVRRRRPDAQGWWESAVRGCARR